MSSKKFDIMKSNDNENNNDKFLFILRNKFRNQNYQFDLQNDQRVFILIKFATSTTQLRNIVTTNIWNIVSNEKIFDKYCDISIFNSLNYKIEKNLFEIAKINNYVIIQITTKKRFCCWKTITSKIRNEKKQIFEIKCRKE